MKLYNLERNYTYYFIIITTLFTSILGQLPGVSFCLSSFLTIMGIFIIIEKIIFKIKFPLSNIGILLFSLWFFTIILVHFSDWNDIKLIILSSLQFFILGSGYKYENEETLFSSLKCFFITYIKIVTAISFIGLLLFGMGLSFTYGELHFIRFGGDFFTGLYLNPNTAGYVSFMAVVFFYFLRIMGVKKFSLNISFLINIITLMMSASRASVMVLGAFVLFYIILNKNIKPIYRKLTIFGLLGVVLMLVLFGDTILMAISVLFGKAEENSDTVLNGRNVLWLEGLYALNDYGIWGTGYSSFAKIMIARNPTLESIGILGGGLHNFYLQTAVSLGCFSLLFFIILIITILQKKIPNEDKKLYNILIGFKCFIISICIYSFFEVYMLYVINAINTFFWLFIGIILFYNKKYGNNEKRIINHNTLL